MKQRGKFGTVMWWLLLAFNALMVITTVNVFRKVFSAQPNETIGSFLAIPMIMILWLIGSMIIGLLVALAPAKRVIERP